MIFMGFLFFVVGACVLLVALGIITDYKLSKQKVERSDFICQKCREKTPVVIHVDKK